MATQSFAQIEERYGELAARTTLDNAKTISVFPGVVDPKSRDIFSSIAGERWEKTPNKGAPKMLRPRFTPEQIKNLPKRSVMIFPTRKTPQLHQAAYFAKVWACRKAMRGQEAATAHASDMKRRKWLVVAIAAACVLLLLMVVGVVR